MASHKRSERQPDSKVLFSLLSRAITPQFIAEQIMQPHKHVTATKFFKDRVYPFYNY